MITALLLLFSLVSLSYAEEQQLVGAVAAVADNKEIRILAVQSDPASNSLSAAGVKFSVDHTTGETVASAKLDAGAFKFQAKTGVSSPVVGFAGLSATLSVDWTPTPDGTGKLSYSVAGSWAEIIFGVTHVFLYQERKAPEGFQYSLGDNVWDCNVQNGLDCLIGGSIINLQNDLNWIALDAQSYACPTASGYNGTDCRVHQITAEGRWPLTTNAVVTVRITFASQKVLLNYAAKGHEIGPDYAKADLIITYPYVQKFQTGNKAIANIGVSGYAAGKAGSAAEVGTFKDNQAFIFKAVDTDRAAVWAWDGSAALTKGGVDSDSDVFVVGISGTSIKDYDCSGCDVVSLLIIGNWKFSVNWVEPWGWRTQIVILSFPGVNTDTVTYDPEYGMATTAEYSTGSSGIVVPALFLSSLWVLVQFFFNRFY